MVEVNEKLSDEPVLGDKHKQVTSLSLSLSLSIDIYIYAYKYIYIYIYICIILPCSDSLRGSSVKIGAMQRRLAWPPRKDGTRKPRSVKQHLALSAERWSLANTDSPVSS